MATNKYQRPQGRMRLIYGGDDATTFFFGCLLFMFLIPKIAVWVWTVLFGG